MHVSNIIKSPSLRNIVTIFHVFILKAKTLYHSSKAASIIDTWHKNCPGQPIMKHYNQTEYDEDTSFSHPICTYL